VALTLALAEPHCAPRGLLNEGSAAADQADRHCRRTTTSDTTASPLREPLAIRRMPFMHNVLAKRRAEGTSA
jgi:hypothetical protein